MFKRYLLVLLALAIFGLTDSVSAAPKGAIKLPSDKVFENNGYHCGQLKGAWIAGKMIKNGFFYSHAAERKNMVAQAKLATGKKRRSLNTKAKNLKGLIAARNPVCAGGPGGGASNALKFNLSGAVGLALGSASLSSFDANGVSFLNNGIGSNMRKVNSVGQMEEVVSSGQATISKFLIAPNDRIYVLFSQRTNLGDTTQQYDPDGCLLAEIDRSTGQPICIDNEVSSIQWLGSKNNKSIQFDSLGAIYYLAVKSDGKSALRKHSGGVTSDLINDNITIGDFLTLQDGSVILSGRTVSSNQSWIRKRTSSGGLQTLKNLGAVACNTMVNFIRIFPDNKIYFGLDDCNPGGIYRMEKDADSFEAAPWMGVSTTWVNGAPVALPTPVAFDCSPPYTDPVLGPQLSQGCGAYINQSYRTPDGKMFFIAGSGTNSGLFKYYPTVAKHSTIVSQVTIAQGVLGNMILAGLNSSDKNVLSLFNTTDNSEIELIGPSNEIEVYRINYIASENKIMFDGLRFSDNKYVLGQVDLDTMQVTTSQTGSSKLEDFQVF